jgi:hypothetical protein
MRNLSLLLLGATLTLGAYAQNSQVLDSDTINLDGYVQKDVPASDRELNEIQGELNRQRGQIEINKKKTRGYEKLSRSTEKLAEETEEMIEQRNDFNKKNEKFVKKIECLMGKKSGPECDKYVKKEKPVEDSVSTQVAAPQKVVMQAPPVENNDSLGGPISLIMGGGVDSASLNDTRINSLYNLDIKLEKNINERFSMGLGFGFSQTQLNEVLRDLGPSNWLDQIQSDFFASELSAYGKFFYFQKQSLSMYVGAGLNFSYTYGKIADIKIRDGFNPNNRFDYASQGFDRTNTAFGGQLNTGVNYKLTKSIGINLDLGYTTSFSSGTYDQPYFSNNPPPQFTNGAENSVGDNEFNRYVDTKTDQLADAGKFTIFAGLSVEF